MINIILWVVVVGGIAMIVYSKRQYDRQMDAIDAMGREKIDATGGHPMCRNTIAALDAMGEDFENINRGEN